ncbi:MAG: oxygen-independent coproporphyrinogen III oxidase [Candidatus Eremiobacteraeota bacterium]|nr:oxygen-independent coproporphyrinogen III oxidase [Candidatus Eremiobacteraeota bacterium]
MQQPSSQSASSSFPAEAEWPALLAKYDHPVPRYTSYPPVPIWSDDPSTAHRRILESAQREGRSAMYVHVPFCHALCYYCACNRVVTKDATVADRYIDAIELELDAISQRLGKLPLTALHWGGGTPNSLTAQQVDRLFRAITSRFPIERGAEISIEVDPRQASRDQIAHFGALGFNRLSAGVQDFNVPTQRAINRIQSLEQTEEVVEWAREFDFADVNIDIVYGLPYQTRDSFALTLEDVLSLAPDSIAAFAYAHVPWVNHAQHAYEAALPEPLEKFGMLVDAQEIFAEAGYQPVGIDHFAAPESSLARAFDQGTVQRTFMGYTPRRAATLIGVGASAISSSHDAYSQNVSEVPQYCGATHHGALAKRGCLLSEDDLARKSVIDALMTTGRIESNMISLPDGLPFGKYFAGSLIDLRTLADDGLLELSDNGVHLTPLGRLFARNVASCFDARVPGDSQRHASAV